MNVLFVGEPERGGERVVVIGKAVMALAGDAAASSSIRTETRKGGDGT